MEQKIDLKAILAKHSFNIEKALKIERVNSSTLRGEEALAAMREIWNTAVDECTKHQKGSIYSLNLEQVKQMIK